MYVPYLPKIKVKRGITTTDGIKNTVYVKTNCSTLRVNKTEVLMLRNKQADKKDSRKLLKSSE